MTYKKPHWVKYRKFALMRKTRSFYNVYTKYKTFFRLNDNIFIILI